MKNENKVQSVLKYFDIETQLTIEPIDGCNIVPVDFFSKKEEQIEFFKMNFRNSHEGNHMEWPLYQSIDEDYEANGTYNYLPFFHKQTVSLLNYFDWFTYFFTAFNTATAARPPVIPVTITLFINLEALFLSLKPPIF